MPFTIEMTPRGVLLASMWLTKAQLDGQTDDDIRNGVIVVLSHNSRETIRTLQGWDDDTLVGKLAVLVALLETKWAEFAWCKTATTDDHRNSIITNLGPRLHRGLDLQGESNQTLAHLALTVSPSLIPIAEGVESVSPAIDGDYIYFAANGLVRCRLDGSDRQTLSTKRCAHRPFIDGDYIYFAADGLNQCKKKDGSDPKLIDDRCRAAPFVDGEYVYFAGGRDGLYRRNKEGLGGAQQIDDHCRAAPFVDGEYIYFAGGRDGLYRRNKKGSGGAQQIDDHCGKNPTTDADYVYFVGGPRNNALYQKLKAGSDLAYRLHSVCDSGVAVKDGWVYFVAGTTLYRCPIHNNHESRWMAGMWDRIKDTPLWQIAIPSTHDSLALYGKADSGPAGDLNSSAQGLKVRGQLEAGIRCFDLRLKWWNNYQKYYPFHGITDYTRGQDLDEVSTDFKIFLDANSSEIVILRLRIEGGNLGEAINRIILKIGSERFVGKTFVRNQSVCRTTPAGCTPNELIKAKKQVIILWDGGGHTDHDLVWRENESSFQITKQLDVGNITDPDVLVRRTASDLDWWTTKYREIQSSEPSSPSWWGLGVHTTCTHVGGLSSGAEESLPIIVRALRIAWKDKPWNTVGGDLFSANQYVDFSNAVIELNGNFKYEPLPQAAIEMTLGGVLLAGKWRTADDLKKMTKEDIRNTLIVELSGHSKQPVGYFQRFDDNALVGKGATVVFLMEARIRDNNALKNMSDDDQRNTLIVENGNHTGKTGSEMWKMSDQQLVQLGLEWFAEQGKRI